MDIVSMCTLNCSYASRFDVAFLSQHLSQVVMEILIMRSSLNLSKVFTTHFLNNTCYLSPYISVINYVCFG